MMIKRIARATRTIGQTQGYIGLPLRDEILTDEATGTQTRAMVTAWEPTPEELKILQEGGHVYLRVIGIGHPPVMIWAAHDGEEPPTDPAEALVVAANNLNAELARLGNQPEDVLKLMLDISDALTEITRHE